MGAVKRPEKARAAERKRRAEKQAKKRRTHVAVKPAMATELEKVAEQDPDEESVYTPAVSEANLAREKVRRWDARQQGWLYTMPLTHEVVARREATETYMVLDRPALKKEVLAYEEAAPC